MSRRLLVMATVALAVGTLTAGIVAGRRSISPRAALAHAKPPPPGDVTAQLSRRILTVQVTAVGHRRPAGGFTVAAGAAAGPDAVVTSVAIRPGSRLGDGALVADVSGAPLIAVVLPFPLYRDIAVGDRGPDVTALEEVLGRLGYLATRHASVDTTVRDAAARFLTDRGYPQLLPTASGAGKPGEPVLRRAWLTRIDKPGRTVSSVGIRVGSVISDATAPIVSCDVAAPAVQALVDHDAGARIRPGDAATVADNASGTTVTGSVAAVGAVGQQGVPITIDADRGTSFAALSGDLVVTVASRLGRGPVLSAPVTALYTDVDGATHVLLPGSVAGRNRAVAVTLGPCADGWCEIEHSDERLVAGDHVVVGASGARTDD